MKTVTLRNRTRALWKLFLFCFVFLLGALAVTIVGASPRAPGAGPVATSREFWVKSGRADARTFRKVHATLRSSGEQSAIYVEDKLFDHGVGGDFVNRLEWQLDTAAPPAAITPGQGVISLEESSFGHLPVLPGRDSRLVVLFADLGEAEGSSAEGFVNRYDQLTDAEAMRRYGQHSNEANLIYVNGFRRSETYTSGIVARELEHLLAARGPARESWLAESLAEGAMLIAGFYGDQNRVDGYLADPARFPLVAPAPGQYGPQLLFASFLLDSLPLANGTALAGLAASPKPGREAVEELWQRLTDAPLSFDAIFSNFVSYVLTQSEGPSSLPSAWRHDPGIRVPAILSHYTYQPGAGDLVGFLAPYSFVAVDLTQPLAPTAVIQLERMPPPNGKAGSCAAAASVLWKPVSAHRIAIYAVGCDPAEKGELVQFRLRIVDQPSLPPRGTIKILR